MMSGTNNLNNDMIKNTSTVNVFATSPALTPNQITVNSSADLPVLTIKFDKIKQQFVVSSTGEIPDASSTDPYLTLILKNKYGKDNKIIATLNSNEDGSNFKAIVNSQSILFGQDILTLIYKDNTKIQITNYPAQGTTYVPTNNFNIFSVFNTNLKDISFNSSIKILNYNNKEMSSIYFAKPVSLPFVTIISTSTNVLSTSVSSSSEDYIQYLKYNNNSVFSDLRIPQMEDATIFSSALDGSYVDINTNDVLRLSNLSPGKISITNYKNQNLYTLGAEPEFLEINATSLIPHSLNYNKIRFKNSDNSTILYLYFDKLDNTTIYMEPFSTGIVNNDTPSFSFMITDYSETTIKLQGTIASGQTGDVVNIDPAHNISKNFNLGDILTLKFTDGSLIEVSDIPNVGNIYNPTDAFIKFELTENGLVTVAPLPIKKFASNFVFNTAVGNTQIANVEFDRANKRLLVSSSGIHYSSKGSNTAFKLSLIASDGTTIKASEIIGSDQTADSFKASLNNKFFAFGDFIDLTYLDPTTLILKDYPDIGDTYPMSSSLTTERFVITQNGVTPILTPNKITIKSKSGLKVLTIEFNQARQQFIVSSTGIIPDLSSTAPYLTLISKNNLGADNLRVTLNSNETGSNFKSLLNSKSVQFGQDMLTLIYGDKTKIAISNYPSKGTTYIPKNDFNSFLVLSNNLSDISFNSKIKFVNDNNEEMSSIYFVKSATPSPVTLVATSTAAISTSTGSANEVYSDYLQYNKTSPSLNVAILKTDTSSTFASALDGKQTDVTTLNILRLSNNFKNRIIVTNYKGQNQYKVGIEPEFLEINTGSLAPHLLNYSKIRLLNKDGSIVLQLYFDKIDNSTIYIESYSTGVINNDTASFTFKITDPTGANVKIQGTINKGDTGDVINIDPTLNSNISNGFNFGDILTLGYTDSSLVMISDFPFKNPFYNPQGATSQKFIITQKGLKSTILDSAIILSNNIGQEMLKLQFDILNQQLIVTATDKIDNSGPLNTDLFSFDFFDIISQSIAFGKNALQLASTLNGSSFNFNSIFSYSCYEGRYSQVTITNYPKKGQNFTPTTQFDFVNIFVEANRLIVFNS